MGKSIDLRVTTRERAWAEGNKGRKRAKKKSWANDLSTTPLLSPARNLRDASEQSE